MRAVDTVNGQLSVDLTVKVEGEARPHPPDRADSIHGTVLLKAAHGRAEVKQSFPSPLVLVRGTPRPARELCRTQLVLGAQRLAQEQSRTLQRM